MVPKIGSGRSVEGIPPETKLMDIDSRLAARAHHIRSSRIRELAPYMALPGMISFGGGYPNPQYCAFREFGIDFSSGTADRITGSRASEAFQYGPTAGNQRLIEKLLTWHNDKFNVSLFTVILKHL